MKRKYIIIIGVIILITSLIVGYNQYKKFFKGNIVDLNQKKVFIYIPTGSNFQCLLDSIEKTSSLIDFQSFIHTARLKNLTNHIRPGKYQIKENMNNNELVNMFRSGKQSFVNLSFNNVRTLDQLAGIIAKQIEADSLSLYQTFTDKEILQGYNLNNEEVLSVFIPNTYEFYWNTSSDKFFERMIRENEKFWNQNRMNKAEELNMTTVEISTLASIIDEETAKLSEKPRIAGVYINRLKRKIALRADPTIKFALKNFFIKRVTDKDLEVDSPYNTYKYNGLPPGPIRIASISSIDAVLNYEKHSYYYFCAKDDFSGYHVFAKTLMQHNQNARKYHKALNRNRIFK